MPIVQNKTQQRSLLFFCGYCIFYFIRVVKSIIRTLVDFLFEHTFSYFHIVSSFMIAFVSLNHIWLLHPGMIILDINTINRWTMSILLSINIGWPLWRVGNMINIVWPLGIKKFSTVDWLLVKVHKLWIHYEFNWDNVVETWRPKFSTSVLVFFLSFGGFGDVGDRTLTI